MTYINELIKVLEHAISVSENTPKSIGQDMWQHYKDCGRSKDEPCLFCQVFGEAIGD